MPTIELKPITKDNWYDACQLKVKDSQKNFVAENGKSILQSIYESDYDAKIMGVYDEDTMVGFMMTGIAGKNEDPDARWIFRFMIGADYQGKGYGRTALEVYLAQVKSEGKYKQVKLSYVPDNHGAKALYEKLGFVEIGIKEEWDEMVAVYNLINE